MVFMLHGLQFPTRGRSNAEKDEYREEEDLHFNAPGTLEDLRKMWPLTGSYTVFVERWRLKTWQDWLMQMNQHVAKAYGIHRHDLLSKWVNHYGISLCFAGDDKLEGINLDAPEFPDDEPEEVAMDRPDLDEIRKRAEHEVEEKDTPGGIAHFGIKKFFEGSIYDAEVGPVLKKRIQDFIHQSIMESHNREGLRQLRQDLKDLLAHAEKLEKLERAVRAFATGAQGAGSNLFNALNDFDGIEIAEEM